MEGKSKFDIGDKVFILDNGKEITEHEITGVAIIFTRNSNSVTYWLDNPGYPSDIVKDELECFADRSTLEEYLAES